MTHLSDKATDHEVLQAAIDKAIANGYRGRSYGHWVWHPDGGENLYGPVPDECADLLFDHEFCRALWGEFDNQNANWSCYPAYRAYEEPEAIPYWQYHLQQLAIAEDRIDYLRKNLP